MHDFCIVSSAVFCFTKIIVISTFIATCCWQSLVEGKINRFSISLTLKQCSLIIYKGIKNSKLVKSFTFFLYVWYKTANLVVERVCKMWRTKSAEKALKSKRKRSQTERQMNLPVCRFEGSPTTDQQRMNKKRASHPACWATCSWQVEPLCHSSQRKSAPSGVVDLKSGQFTEYSTQLFDH